MKKIVIGGQKFSLSETSEIFLNKYLSKMKTFMKKNDIEIEVYDDIEERISERFNESIPSKTKREISDTIVIDIVNEIWEPDEIFADLLDDSAPEVKKESKINFKEYFSNENETLTRNSEEWIIFWVCYWIGDRYGIDPLWIRLWFVFGAFLWGMTLFLYIILAILLPNIAGSKKKVITYESKVDKKEAKKENKGDEIKEKNIPLKNTPTQKSEEQKDEQIVEKPPVIEVPVQYIKTKAPSFFKEVGLLIKRVFFFLLWIIRIMIAALLSVWAIPVILSFLLVSGMFFADLSFDNQKLFTHLHLFLKIWAVWMLMSLAFLIIWIIWKLLKWKWFTNILMFIGFIGILSFLFVWSVWFFNTFNNYSNVYEKTETYDFGNNEAMLDRLSAFWESTSMINGVNWVDNLEFRKSNTGSIKIEVVSKINAKNQAVADSILSELTPLEFEMDPNIWFWLDWKSTFKKEVAFSFLRRDIIIYIPEKDFDLRIGDLYEMDIHEINNLYYEDDGEYENYWISYHCMNTKVEYNEEKWFFVCRK